MTLLLTESLQIYLLKQIVSLLLLRGLSPSPFYPLCFAVLALAKRIFLQWRPFIPFILLVSILLNWFNHLQFFCWVLIHSVENLSAQALSVFNNTVPFFLQRPLFNHRQSVVPFWFISIYPELHQSFYLFLLKFDPVILFFVLMHFILFFDLYLGLCFNLWLGILYFFINWLVLFLDRVENVDSFCIFSRRILISTMNFCF